jgi:amino acid permease
VSLPVLVYVLTGFAAVVVVLTRVRLRRQETSSHHQVGSGLANVHTVAGALAVLVWGGFLAFPEDTFVGGSLVGVIGLGFWWVTMFAGLLLLTRWLPSRGKRAASTDGSRLTGAGLSVVTHLGMFVAVLVFTWAYLTSAV